MNGISEDLLARARARRRAGQSRLGRRPQRDDVGFQINAYPKVSTLEILATLQMSPGEILDAVADCVSGKANWKERFAVLDRVVNS